MKVKNTTQIPSIKINIQKNLRRPPTHITINHVNAIPITYIYVYGMIDDKIVSNFIYSIRHKKWCKYPPPMHNGKFYYSPAKPSLIGKEIEETRCTSVLVNLYTNIFSLRDKEFLQVVNSFCRSNCYIFPANPQVFLNPETTFPYKNCFWKMGNTLNVIKTRWDLTLQPLL